MKQISELRTLKKNSDFRSVYSFVKYKFSVKHFTLLIKKNDLGYNRMGLVVSSKIGKAVIRNKIKRRLKMIGREIFPLAKKSYDYVIIAKIGIKDAEFVKIKDSLIYSLKTLNIIDIKK